MAWMTGRPPPAIAPRGGAPPLGALRAQLHARGEGAEVARVGAAYKLGLLGRCA